MFPPLQYATSRYQTYEYDAVFPSRSCRCVPRRPAIRLRGAHCALGAPGYRRARALLDGGSWRIARHGPPPVAGWRADRLVEHRHILVRRTRGASRGPAVELRGHTGGLARYVRPPRSARAPHAGRGGRPCRGSDGVRRAVAPHVRHPTSHRPRGARRGRGWTCRVALSRGGGARRAGVVGRGGHRRSQTTPAAPDLDRSRAAACPRDLYRRLRCVEATGHALRAR